MRSVINTASPSGIAAIVDQQFAVAAQILDHGLMPIIEPEVNIKAADKAACEDILKKELLKHVNALPEGREIMLKLTLPETPGLYSDLIGHKNVLRVVALSGGYSLEEACQRLSRNSGMIASFSRALSNDLRADQSDEAFNATLSTVIDKIYGASVNEQKKTQAA
jgi:fructose-bisphosphate aldolase class I